jgi:hypothetical protein
MEKTPEHEPPKPPKPSAPPDFEGFAGAPPGIIQKIGTPERKLKLMEMTCPPWVM